MKSLVDEEIYALGMVATAEFRIMGTSYYCYEKNHRRKHIGKQSCRWRFLFHGYSEPGLEIKSYLDWKKHLLSKEFEIYNEYHKKIKKKIFSG